MTTEQDKPATNNTPKQKSQETIKNRNSKFSLKKMVEEATQQLTGTCLPGKSIKQPTKSINGQSLSDGLKQAEQFRWEQPKLTPAEKKIKKKKIKLLCQLVEDYLERDLDTVSNNLGLRIIDGEIITGGAKANINNEETKSIAKYISIFNNLVYDLLATEPHDDENQHPQQTHKKQWQDSASTTFENYATLRSTWDIAKEYISHHNRYNMEYATLPILLKESYIHVAISDEHQQKETVRFKTVPNILVHNFIRFLDGLPLKYFSLCKYEKCKKCIIVITTRKSFCTHNNCGSRVSIDRQRNKDLEAFQEKDRLRKRKEYAAKKLAKKKTPPKR